MGYTRGVIFGSSLVGTVLVISILMYFFSRGPCPSGTTPCDGGTVCVPQRMWCDGVPHCRDKQDETTLECGTVHGSKKSLGEIIRKAIHVSTSTPPVCELVDVPAACFCQPPTVLLCSNASVPRLPRVRNVSVLKVKHERLMMDEEAFRGYEDLEQLNLVDAGVYELPGQLFGNLTRLKTLVLENNTVKSISASSLRHLHHLGTLHLKNNQLEDLELPDLQELQWLDLANNKINVLRRFSNLSSLMELNLGHNMIEEIKDGTFEYLTSLHFLGLKFNRIRSISGNAFKGLSQLRELDLSSNRLRTLPHNTLFPMTSLEGLRLGDNPIKLLREHFVNSQEIKSLNLNGISGDDIDFVLFKYMPNVKFVRFKAFRYCAKVPHKFNCKPTSDGVSSLQDLVTRPSLRLAAWTIALLTLFGNLLVLWGRFTSRDENRALSLLIRNLAVADMLMGIYLLVIAIQDVRFRNVYNQYTEEWTDSFACSLMGALAMTSSEVSMLILAFMSVERFLLIVDPLGGHPRLTTRVARNALILLWGIGISLAIIPIFQWKNMFYGSNGGMCFPLHLQDKYLLGWQYSVFIFLVVNMIGLLVIASAYGAMFVSVWKTRKASATTADCEFAIRFFFIVLTNAACWVPIVCLKILNFVDVELSGDVYAWLVVFIVPLNSAVNPLLYTFTTPKYRDHLFSFSMRYSTKQSSTDTTESSRMSSNKNLAISTVTNGFAKSCNGSELNMFSSTNTNLDCKL